MKVLVTGGAGYIGSHTVRQLVKTGADVTVLDNMVYGHAGALVDPEVKLVKGDLGDASVVYPLLMKGNFDAVIHFAAFEMAVQSGALGRQDPALEVVPAQIPAAIASISLNEEKMNFSS